MTVFVGHKWNVRIGEKSFVWTISTESLRQTFELHKNDVDALFLGTS